MRSFFGASPAGLVVQGLAQSSPGGLSPVSVAETCTHASVAPSVRASHIFYGAASSSFVSWFGFVQSHASAASKIVGPKAKRCTNATGPWTLG